MRTPVPSYWAETYEVHGAAQTMPLTRDDLEMPRTPLELRAFVELVRERVHHNPVEFESGMTKKGYYKEFLDEVVPLCNFAEVAYPPEYRVQPVLGNQGYDALVFDNQGAEEDKVEFTKPYDGAAAAASESITGSVLTFQHPRLNSAHGKTTQTGSFGSALSRPIAR